MKSENNPPDSSVTAAVEAIDNLAWRELDEIVHRGQVDAMFAHDEIGLALINQRSGIFYRHFAPIRNQLILLLANSYRRYIKVALVHRREIGSHADQWALHAIQPAIQTAVEWLRDWYILACDGENQHIQKVGSVPFVPGETVSIPIPLTAPPLPPPQSWRAPAWLFQVSPTLGILLLRSEKVPADDSEERLGESHTRLLLRGARRSFLWQLEEAVEIVRNEEVAAAGAIPVGTLIKEMAEGNKRPKHWSKGIEGLTCKADLSRYKHGLTEKQELAFSLKYEYGLGLTEIASRMGLDRKTAYEHIKAAESKIEQVRSSEKRGANPAKNRIE